VDHPEIARGAEPGDWSVKVFDEWGYDQSDNAAADRVWDVIGRLIHSASETAVERMLLRKGGKQ
jgi:hypothetical protein